MKSLLILIFSAFSTQLLGQTIINDPNVEVRNVGSFSGIKASDGIDIYLSQSDDYALGVSASDKKYIDGIKTEIKNGVLVISYDGSSFKYNNNRKLRAYISFKNIESLEASGACDYVISGTLIANSLRIKLSGASEVKGAINIENLQIDISGASLAKLNGTAQNLNRAEAIFKKYNPEYPFDARFVDEAYTLKSESEKRQGTLAGLFAGLTVFAWSEVLETAELSGRGDVGALRLRTIATKDKPCNDFPYKNGDDYDPAVILDLDYWVLIPR